MEDKSYVKISKQDYDIAENFFQNDKHLDEFISNVSRYYCGKKITIKTKIVQRYFETYKKTMDFILNARSFGKTGGSQRVNNQSFIEETLEGYIEGELKQPIKQIVNNKVINNNSKQDKEISKEILSSENNSIPKKREGSIYGDGELDYLCVEFYQKNPTKYPAEMYKDFLTYWTAPIINGSKKDKGKELWRTHKTFQVSGRLSTWHQNNLKRVGYIQPNYDKSKSIFG